MLSINLYFSAPWRKSFFNGLELLGNKEEKPALMFAMKCPRMFVMSVISELF